MFSLITSLLRPYRGSLAAILAAMLAQTAMSVAAPWPLKVVLDNVVGAHHLPPGVAAFLQPFLSEGNNMSIAAAAAIATAVIALLGAIASYIGNYYTTSVGQWVANDLRMRTYHHLQQLSLRYYNEHDTGTLLSTITADVQTIQAFASSSTLGILVDVFTIVGMLGIVFWLNWDFTLMIVALTPIMLLLISRFKKAIKKATKEVRKQQSRIVSVLTQDLQSMRVIKAFGRQDLEQEELSEVSKATVQAGKSTVVAACDGDGVFVYSLRTLEKFGTDFGWSDDRGSLTVFLYYLTNFFKPVQDLAKMTNSIAQTAVGVDRIRAILDADDMIPQKPDAQDPPPLRGNKQVYGSLRDAVNAAEHTGKVAELNDERLTNLHAAQEDINKLAGFEEVGRGRSRQVRWINPRF